MNVMRAMMIFFCALLISASMMAQDHCQYKVVAFTRDKQIPFCGSNILADSSGFIYMSTGCESHAFFWLDKFHIKNDTIWIDKFDFMSEKAFVSISKKKSASLNQTVTFKSIEGIDIDYNFDHREIKETTVYHNIPNDTFKRKISDPVFAIAINQTGKRRKLVLKNASLTFKNGTVKVLDLTLLQRIYGVPVTFWPAPGYDYTITLNFPDAVLSRYCVHGVSNFRDKYLLLQNDTLLMPGSGMKLKISCRQ